MEDEEVIMPGNLRCSFCGKGEDDVAKLVAGPNVYICDECVRIATDLMDDEHPKRSASVIIRSLVTRLLDLVRGPRRALEM